MQVCGVEIKGTEAVISLLSNHGGLINIPECRVRKIEYTKKKYDIGFNIFSKYLRQTN